MVLELRFDPVFELADGFALHRHLDVGIEGVHVFARAVAHKGLAHVLHDTRFHKARVERVAKVLKAEVTDACSPNSSFPGRLDPADGPSFERENESSRLLHCQKKCCEPPCKRNLAGFSAWSFRVSDREHLTNQVDVLPALGEKFSAPHTGVQGRDCDLPQMRRGRIEQFRFLGDIHDRPRLATWFRQPDAGEWVCGHETFVERPI